ncbi:lipid-A-disaccharide synthase [Amphibiibacter pelophylacis]|uniref:Lipid-A-disaccharide synthase n=1 Tax=Amphibiibacter pelophylacis TaxID=1799477 RepID=A0ACC6P0X8_9BURK
MGEVSGDLLAARLLAGARERWPGLLAYGIAGPASQAQGMSAWWPHTELAVRGYAEVLRHYPRIAGVRRLLIERLLADPPDVFIGVDAPDFNLHVEKRLRESGVPTVHFICPSIWAWRGGRVRHLQESCDRVLCVFPFEPELLARHGIAATYVGHPLASVIPDEPDRAGARQRLGLAADVPVVAVLPGSRSSEIDTNGPVFLRAVARLHALRPELRFVLPAVPGLHARLAELIAREAPWAGVQLLDGDSYTALAACDVTLIASGTATLEAALFKRPMVVAYVMNGVSWQIMKRMGYQPWVGLPNILAQRFLVPERLQDAATPDQLAQDILGWLDQPQRVADLQTELHALHERLRRDTPGLCAQALDEVLTARRGRSPGP